MLKKLAASIFVLATISHSYAADFNPEAYLAANPDVRAAGLGAYQHIASITEPELSVRLGYTAALVAKTTAVHDVKVMFADSGILDESTTVIQPMIDWYASTGKNKTSMKDMIKAGWSLQNAFAVNTKQFYLTFVK